MKELLPPKSQTGRHARDTTIGPPQPKGERGSAAADDVAVGEEVDEEDNPLAGP